MSMSILNDQAAGQWAGQAHWTGKAALGRELGKREAIAVW